MITQRVKQTFQVARNCNCDQPIRIEYRLYPASYYRMSYRGINVQLRQSSKVRLDGYG